MARKPARQAVPKTIASATAPERPRGGTAGLVVRGALACAVVLLVLSAWNFYRDYLTANVLSRFADMKATDQNELVVGLADIRKAYNINPADPDIQLRLANTILKQETQKVRAQDFRSVDFKNLEQCLNLLREAQKSNLKPHFVQLKFAEAANLAVRYLQMTGQGSQADPFVREAVSNLVAFRNQQGIAREKADAIYALAIDLSASDPSIMLRFWDDYARAFGDDSFRNKEVMMKVMRSYRWMGEFQMLSARLANATLHAPDDGDYLNILDDLARRLDRKAAVILLLDELERQDKLTARGRAMRAQLMAG